MRVSVDRDLCQASGYCARSAAALFGVDGDGIVFLHGDDLDGPMSVPDHHAESVRAAARDCPSGAIVVDPP